MLNIPRFLPLITLGIIIPLSWLSSQAAGANSATDLPLSEASTPMATAFPTPQESWITLDLPPDATQQEIGAEIYRLVCSACHAYDGTGLTDEWRSTWDPDSQNCWQSKCHAENHPSDGFYLPYSPAIVGPVIPALFETAYDLYEYTYNEMPWHNPQSLAESEVWAVTSHVLVLNQFDPGPILNEDTAKSIRLRPVSQATETTTIVKSTQEINPSPTNNSTSEISESYSIERIAAGIAVTFLFLIGIYILRRTNI